MKLKLFLIFCLFVAIGSCKKDPYVNPYDKLVDDNGNGSNPNVTLDPNSFAGIHANILKKTCANSGCHDGNFEPDFRTVESSYNMLVYQPVIKNNPQGIYTYRVLPNDVQLSVLYKRLIEDIDGQSGIMPLALEPDSDWEDKKQQYIGNIYNWIQNGAKDIFGNMPSVGVQPIQLAGLVATATGSNIPLPRSDVSGAIQVSAQMQSIDIWFSLLKGNNTLTQFESLTIKTSNQLNDFSASDSINANLSNAQSWPGFSGNNIPYQFKVSLNTQLLSSGLNYFRVKLIENLDSELIEMPNNGSALHVKKYYAIELIP